MDKRVKIKSRLNKEYKAVCEFGIRFENGEAGIIEKGEILKVLRTEKGKSYLEKIGWLSHRSSAWRYLKEIKYNQMEMKL